MATRHVIAPAASSGDSPLQIPGLTVGRFEGARGTSFLSSGGNFASGFASVAFGFTPTIVIADANEGNTLATIQNWSSAGYTVTEKNVNAGGVLGTVGFCWFALA